ncbi:MAG: hypothetical protein ISS47_09875 [Candidatus Omnitrophica bacterium]|nr:hypothetical protein [Candidatus Omnitrophota bacterium]
MIRRCLIISFIWHLFCISCFNFPISPNPQLDIYSINFLGSILKQTDFLFIAQTLKATSVDSLPLNIFLLPNRKKSIKLYNKDFRKPFLSLSKILPEVKEEYKTQIYMSIGSKLKQGEDSKQVEIDILPADWKKIKLKIK